MRRHSASGNRGSFHALRKGSVHYTNLGMALGGMGKSSAAAADSDSDDSGKSSDGDSDGDGNGNGGVSEEAGSLFEKAGRLLQASEAQEDDGGMVLRILDWDHCQRLRLTIPRSLSHFHRPTVPPSLRPYVPPSICPSLAAPSARQLAWS